MNQEQQTSSGTDSIFVMEEIFSDNYSIDTYKLLSQRSKKLVSQMQEFKTKDNNEKQE
jgi:hypothetical protein